MPGGTKGSHTIPPPSPILSFRYMCTTNNFIYINFRSLNEHMADPSPILQAIYTAAFSCSTSSLSSLLDTTFGYLISSMGRRYRFMNTLSFIWVLSGASSKKIIVSIHYERLTRHDCLYCIKHTLFKYISGLTFENKSFLIFSLPFY